MSNENTNPKHEEAIGICLGASTFSMVQIEKDGHDIKVKNITIDEHNGDPKGTFSKHLDQQDLNGKYIAITGRKFREITNIPSLIEPEATEIAYRHLTHGHKKHDAIVSAGGETFIVYEIDNKGKVSRISSGNKCASGTGEFFLQQIRRMNVSIGEAVELARSSKKPHELSGRCSVFCKSDCTHALNKGESIADVAAGLSQMIAKKIDELLVKIGAKKVLIVGGTAQNDVVINLVRKNFEKVDTPKEAPYFEALGAALWAMEKKQDKIPEKGDYFKELKSSFEKLKPLSEFLPMVDFKEMPFEQAQENDECIIGLDVGSTTTKIVLLRTSDEKILVAKYLRTNGNPIEASKQCYAAVIEQLGHVNVKIIGLGVTGSGRYIAGLHAETEGIINEIIAHAKAAAHFDNGVDTIFEIGGQDAKYTHLTNGVASDYAMNEACSAGTGSFLEESAFETLNVKMEDIAPIALKADSPPNFSDQCAAFISSDINTALQEGISKENIIAGLVYSICINYVNRVKGSRQTGHKIFMQGGVCYNKAVPVAMAALTGKTIIVPPHPGLMGSYGVALEVKDMIELGFLHKKGFNLKDLAHRDVTYGKPFICQGAAEHCDRKCEIAMININNKKFPFGGACNKYYNEIHKVKYDITQLNHIETRQKLLYNTFVTPSPDIKPDAKVVGINRSFHTNTLYPMYFNFFNALGLKVILPDSVQHEGVDKGMTSFCLAGQIALGMFDDLLRKNPDYVFVPHIKEMHVSEQKEYRIEYQTTCMFVQGEPWYLRATFLRDKENPPKLIAPVLNFMAGFDKEEKQFIKIAEDLGFSAAEGEKAHKIAFQKQQEFFKAMKEEGSRILKKLEEDPEKRAIVLFGHPYSAFADEANKGVPFKFASRGIEIIPFDFLMYEDEENYKNTYWEMGQRIIKAARIVKRHPQLFGCYLTNFLCAIDSFMVPHFRDLMGTKPSLTIEVDSHTADAGVNTRIEAFMDVVRNYLKMSGKIKDPAKTFQIAKTEVDQVGNVVFIDSDGKRFPIKHPDVNVVVPSMGDLFAEGTAAVIRGLGWHAEGLPVCDREALDLGRSVTTGKECLPIINIVGEVLKHIKYRKNKNEKLVVMMVGAGGCCRVGQYDILINTIAEKLKLRDVATLVLTNDDGYAGLGLPFRLGMVKSLYTFDTMDDIRSAIRGMAIDPVKGMEVWTREKNNMLASLAKENNKPFFKQLEESIKELAKIRLKNPISKAKYIGLVGEIFVRRDHFALMGIPERLAENGFVMLDAPVTEWIRYTDFLRDIKMYVAKTTIMGKIESLVSDLVQDHYEKKIKKMFVKSGLYEFEMIHIRKYMAHSTHFFPLELTGEPGLSTGSALYHYGKKYCGTISVGPFGCMNSRMTEAVATPEMTVEGKERALKNAGDKSDFSYLKKNMDILPFLSVELDGNPFSQIVIARLETFMLQADRMYDMMQDHKKK